MHIGNKYHVVFIFGHKFDNTPWHHHWSNVVTFSHLTFLQRVKTLDSSNCSSDGCVWPDKLSTESLFWKTLSPMPQLLHGLPFLFWCLYNFLLLTAPSSFLVASASNRQAILEQKILRELFKYFESIFFFSLLSPCQSDICFAHCPEISIFQDSHELSLRKQDWHHSHFLFDIVYHCLLLFLKKIYFICISLNVCTSNASSACVGPERALDPLELEL